MEAISRKLTRSQISVRIAAIERALPALEERLDPCALCPRCCGARRRHGESGECGMPDQLRVASVARHRGEEPPISGTQGAVNIFFTGCNLHCIHCQNWPISQNHVGKNLNSAELAELVLKKWKRGAQSLGWVTPTPQILPALEAYRICLQSGLDLPLVHNNGGYEDPDIIGLLAGIVDIWLPDVKTRDAHQGREVQGVVDYPQRNEAALHAMVAQAEKGEARAVIVRYLTLPNHLEDAGRTLKWLREAFQDGIYLSLMAQYFPTYRTQRHISLGRRLTPEEYQTVIHHAQSLGFERGWIQSFEEEDGIPLSCLS
jgi:putative pyruvate formate lyase activating enzyme